MKIFKYLALAALAFIVFFSGQVYQGVANYRSIVESDKTPIAVLMLQNCGITKGIVVVWRQKTPELFTAKNRGTYDLRYLLKHSQQQSQIVTLTCGSPDSST